MLDLTPSPYQGGGSRRPLRFLRLLDDVLGVDALSLERPGGQLARPCPADRRLAPLAADPRERHHDTGEVVGVLAGMLPLAGIRAGVEVLAEPRPLRWRRRAR